MKPAAWRAVLLLLCGITALGAVMTVLCVTGFGGRPPWSGYWGVANDTIPFGYRVADVDPGGPSDRAGLKPGDRIDLRQSPLHERYWFTSRAFNGKPVALAVRRGATQMRIVVVPRPLGESIFRSWQRFWVYGFAFFALPAMALWLAFFASLIAWRRAGVPEMRLLALTVIVYGINAIIGAQIAEWTTPWLWANIAQDIGSDVAFMLSVALWVALASLYGRPLSGPRRVLQGLCYALIAVQAGLNVASSVGFITLWYDWNLPVFDSNDLFYAILAGASLYSILAIAAARGAERQRSAWILVPLIVLIAVPYIVGSLPNIFPTPSLYFSYNAAGGVGTALQFLAPIALTYAALNRRLIDIGFVLNRSLVFTIVSAIVIVTFIAVEWAAGTWLTGMTRTSSALIGLFVALILGLSLRYIHQGVDSFVDRVFFWKRHEDEAALRRFAHEASYISDRTTLLERAEREIREHTRAQAVSILVPDGDHSYASASSTDRKSVGLSENDPGIVALRAWHKPVDIRSLRHSELRGEFAYPMVSRGTLVGVLVCGSKRDSEVYAPDESEALEAVAQGVGVALDSMGRNSTDGLAALRDAILSLQETLLAELRASRG